MAGHTKLQTSDEPGSQQADSYCGFFLLDPGLTWGCAVKINLESNSLGRGAGGVTLAEGEPQGPDPSHWGHHYHL